MCFHTPVKKAFWQTENKKTDLQSGARLDIPRTRELHLIFWLLRLTSLFEDLKDTAIISTQL